jgi:hypothetical protein
MWMLLPVDDVLGLLLVVLRLVEDLGGEVILLGVLGGSLL